MHKTVVYLDEETRLVLKQPAQQAGNTQAEVSRAVKPGTGKAFNLLPADSPSDSA